MDIRDIFVDEGNNRFKAKITAFNPNVPDEVLKEEINKACFRMQGRAGLMATMTQKELIEFRPDLVDRLNEDAQYFSEFAKCFLELRELTAQIQKERDVLLEFAAKQIGLQKE